jgi:hypothetical protein
LLSAENCPPNLNPFEQVALVLIDVVIHHCSGTPSRSSASGLKALLLLYVPSGYFASDVGGVSWSAELRHPRRGRDGSRSSTSGWPAR